MLCVQFGKEAGYNTTFARSIMEQYFNVQTMMDMAVWLYASFDKTTYAGFAVHVAEGAHKGDHLCLAAFNKVCACAVRSHLFVCACARATTGVGTTVPLRACVCVFLFFARLYMWGSSSLHRATLGRAIAQNGTMNLAPPPLPPLCRVFFEQAGDDLGQHVAAVLPHLSEGHRRSGSLSIICVGSMWKSW